MLPSAQETEGTKEGFTVGTHQRYTPGVCSQPSRASGAWRSKIRGGLVTRSAGVNAGWAGRTSAPEAWWPPGTGTGESKDQETGKTRHQLQGNER